MEFDRNNTIKVINVPIITLLFLFFILIISITLRSRTTPSAIKMYFIIDKLRFLLDNHSISHLLLYHLGM